MDRNAKNDRKYLFIPGNWLINSRRGKNNDI